MKFCYLLICVTFLAITNSSPDATDFNDHFNCVNKYEKVIENGVEKDKAIGWECCGYNGLGERHCAAYDQWEKFQGKYRICKKLPFTTDDGVRIEYPSQMIGLGVDLCCDDGNYVNDCGKCHSFYVWDFLTHDGHDAMVDKATFDDNWREQYLDQNLDNSNGYDNAIFPGGFVKGTLREFNDPNVCIYIPQAAGKVIEIKVESEEAGDRLCIGDLHDEESDRNNPGQNNACGDTNVETCFGDADTSNDSGEYGFPFYIFCDEGCEEGGGSGDVSLWFRARFSPTSWMKGTYLASENVEMWCDYVIRDYPDYDVYPSDITKVVPVVTFDDNSASQFVLTVVFGLSILLVL